MSLNIVEPCFAYNSEEFEKSIKILTFWKRRQEFLVVPKSAGRLMLQISTISPDDAHVARFLNFPLIGLTSKTGVFYLTAKSERLLCEAACVLFDWCEELATSDFGGRSLDLDGGASLYFTLEGRPLRALARLRTGTEVERYNNTKNHLATGGKNANWNIFVHAKALGHVLVNVFSSFKKYFCGPRHNISNGGDAKMFFLQAAAFVFSYPPCL